ncbi:uncharacterized protein H6S33_010930 [Morchella sextelata]|uniref:uncharacterized protein n=1 Tax=Morchella sextelata TaxID=1174677 RepID=UPI001D055A09|nr:uncharacterized protein H6S33_010930 [Morchella sextelata]KAH0611665.1 hypothetical protein H6S33_010930 [Morchella sextelata]
MPYTSPFTPASKADPSPATTSLEARLKNYESALKSSEAELKKIAPLLERKIDKLTVINTAYNQTGRQDIWLPAHTTLSKEAEGLEQRRDEVERDRVKYAAAVRAVRYNLATAKEKEEANYKEGEAKKSEDNETNKAGEGAKKDTNPNEDLDEVMQDV